MKYPIIAARFNQALNLANISARELANKAGMNESSISQYVNGSHCPSNISSGKIAAVLGVSPVWLMGFDVPMTSTLIDEQAALDNARFDARVSNDAELRGAIEKYYSLPREKQILVLNLINSL